MRYAPLFLATLLLAGCESAQQVSTIRSEPATPIKLSAKQIASVRAGVARNFKQNVDEVRVERVVGGRTSTSVVVCGYVNGKNSAGEAVHDLPFQGVFMGLDNASGFTVTGTGGAESENALTFEACRRSGLDLTSS